MAGTRARKGATYASSTWSTCSEGSASSNAPAAPARGSPPTDTIVYALSNSKLSEHFGGAVLYTRKGFAFRLTQSAFEEDPIKHPISLRLKGLSIIATDNIVLSNLKAFWVQACMWIIPQSGALRDAQQKKRPLHVSGSSRLH